MLHSESFYSNPIKHSWSWHNFPSTLGRCVLVDIILLAVKINFTLFSNSMYSWRNFLLRILLKTITSIERTECQAFSPVVRIGSPAPSTASECCSPFGSGGGGGHTRLRERGWGGVANSDEGTDTLVLKVKYNPSMLSSIFINRSEQNSKWSSTVPVP